MSNEWYTPAKYVDAAREVFGGVIDLDPASCELANQTVRAARYYSKEDDGLAQAWYGNVWLNPPYSSDNSPSGMFAGKAPGGNGKGLTGFFIEKLMEEYEARHVRQAIVCVNADVIRNWFQPLWNYPICFSHKKILFHRPGLESQHHYFGTCFVYLGNREQRFIDTFSQFGRIARAVDTPVRSAVTTPGLWEVSA